MSYNLTEKYFKKTRENIWIWMNKDVTFAAANRGDLVGDKFRFLLLINLIKKSQILIWLF
jgi:hypothetical protein